MTKGALTRERIIIQAAPLFNERGFEGTSLSALMEATGLRKGGIYRHFKSKEELAVAAFDYCWKCASRERWLDIDRTASAVDQLRQFVANFVEKRTGLVRGGCPVLNTAIDADDGNTALRSEARKALALWSKRLRRIVKTGIAKGELPADVDADATVTIVISVLEGALMMARLQRSERPLRQARKHLNAFLLSHDGGSLFHHAPVK